MGGYHVGMGTETRYKTGCVCQSTWTKKLQPNGPVIGAGGVVLMSHGQISAFRLSPLSVHPLRLLPDQRSLSDSLCAVPYSPDQRQVCCYKHVHCPLYFSEAHGKDMLCLFNSQT